jgi:histidyl-tRNA synthetase
MKSAKGTRDLLADECRQFQQVESWALQHFSRYGFQEIRTPIFEETALFVRGIGDETDIVSKEMYQLTTKGGDELTLRPEMTASVCRAVIQHNLLANDDLLRFIYMGPMFRYERPQAGRYRQFHQLGAEVFGSDDPLVEVETIEAVLSFLSPFQLPNLTLRLNSVGDSSDRPAYLAYLRQELDTHSGQLCQDCTRRKETNVLRVLDCKNEACRAVLDRLHPISTFWSTTTRDHFEAVCRGLDRLSISYVLDPMLVRGLDYYTRTAFELQSGELGAQSAVLGGGRYDNLVATLGGPDTPAFGWALGLDRLVGLLAARKALPEQRPHLFFIFSQREQLEEFLPLLARLRAGGHSVQFDLRLGSFKSQMKRANRLQARYCAIVGERECQGGTVTLKDMDQSSQREVPQDHLPAVMKEVCPC